MFLTGIEHLHISVFSNYTATPTFCEKYFVLASEFLQEIKFCFM